MQSWIWSRCRGKQISFCFMFSSRRHGVWFFYVDVFICCYGLLVLMIQTTIKFVTPFCRLTFGNTFRVAPIIWPCLYPSLYEVNSMKAHTTLRWKAFVFTMFLLFRPVPINQFLLEFSQIYAEVSRLGKTCNAFFPNCATIRFSENRGLKKKIVGRTESQSFWLIGTGLRGLYDIFLVDCMEPFLSPLHSCLMLQLWPMEVVYKIWFWTSGKTTWEWQNGRQCSNL